MGVALHPIAAQACRDARPHGGSGIGAGFTGPQQEARVVDHQRQAPPPLFVTPANPLVAVAQPAGSRREEQQAKPLAQRIEHRIPEPFADGMRCTQIMVFVEQFTCALDVPGGESGSTRRSLNKLWRGGHSDG